MALALPIEYVLFVVRQTRLTYERRRLCVRGGTLPVQENKYIICAKQIILHESLTLAASLRTKPRRVIPIHEIVIAVYINLTCLRVRRTCVLARVHTAIIRVLNY